jgi:hypothetical protein
MDAFPLRCHVSVNGYNGLIVKAKLRNINQSGHKGYTPLIRAVELRYEKKVQFLLESDLIAANCYNIHRDKDMFFRTPFTALDMVEFGTRVVRLITNDGEDYAKSETIMDMLLSKEAQRYHDVFSREYA